MVHRREWGDREWDRLVKQIRTGKCTPFLGSGASVPNLPTGGELAQLLVDGWGYPFPTPAPLEEVAQYACVMERDFVAVKEHVADRLAEAGLPDFDDPAEPHSLLAGHPIKVFLTTNYDGYMSSALRFKGKEPVAAICPWYSNADRDEYTHLRKDYRPAPERPLVYHLHGSLERARSIVLTERDYAEFLVNIARDISQDDRRVVPTHILPALTHQPLLFIGYSLRDWSFRMLYHGFVAAEPRVMHRRHVSVQLTPEVDPGDLDQAMEFLDRYFDELSVSVFWGDAREFCTELSERLAA